MPSLSIVMSYKENCKAEGHILTRFKIARLYWCDQMTQTDIAQRIQCHRNTIGQVIALCTQSASPEAWHYLRNAQHISQERLQELFAFLEPGSRRPHRHSWQLNDQAEQYILSRHTALGYGPKRLYTTLRREGAPMAIYTLAKIKGVYKRKALVRTTVRTSNGNRRALYEYATIGAFEQLQYDTKEILDKKALPKPLYDFFQKHHSIPNYQWTIIDAKTRTRFLAWSHTRSSWYGATFLFFVICWLRAHGVWYHIHAQMDGGAEFCSASPKKLAVWNTLFAPFNASVSQTDGVKWKQNLVERSHRDDDQEFYVPRGQRMTSKTTFRIEAQQWLLYWNTQRSHSGIDMNGHTPQERLHQLGLHQAHKISHFPVIVLDDLFHPLHVLSTILDPQDAQNVLTYYPRSQTTNYFH